MRTLIRTVFITLFLLATISQSKELTPIEKFYNIDDNMLFESCQSNLTILMNSYLKVLKE